MTDQELQAGIDANNARSLNPDEWKLSWVYQKLFPTSSPLNTFYKVPRSAALFCLQYIMVSWPTTGNDPVRFYGPIFIELIDDRGQRYTYLNQRKPETAQGMNVALFTGPGVATPAALGRITSSPRAMYPIGVDFNGDCNIAINIRTLPGTQFPPSIDLLLVGHRRNAL